MNFTLHKDNGKHLRCYLSKITSKSKQCDYVNCKKRHNKSVKGYQFIKAWTAWYPKGDSYTKYFCEACVLAEEYELISFKAKNTQEAIKRAESEWILMNI